MTWHWTITLEWTNPDGREASCTAHGTLTPDQVAVLKTRTAAVPAIIDAGRRGMHIPADATAAVVFLSLNPDTLADAPAGGAQS